MSDPKRPTRDTDAVTRALHVLQEEVERSDRWQKMFVVLQDDGGQLVATEGCHCPGCLMNAVSGLAEHCGATVSVVNNKLH